MTLEETLQNFIESTRASFLETDKQLKETDKQLKETDKQLKETDKQIKETDKQIKETDRKLRKFEGLFTSQWGRLIEAMVKPAALELFRNRGISVHHTMQNMVIEKPGLNKEFDVILVNGDVVIVVEVKSTLKISDVKNHIRSLRKFHEYLPEYTGKKVYGAVAYLSSAEESEKFAFRQGLFVITLTGRNLVEIKNGTDFKPADFAATA